MSERRPSAFRVIINDDFDSHMEFDASLFDMWGGTSATTFSLCLGGDVVNYDSGVRATLAENLRLAHEAGRIPSEHVRYWHEFLAAGKRDPVAIAIEGCRRNGLEFFASLRMNDIHHGADPDDPVLGLLVSPFWREHPELRAKGWERPRQEAFTGRYPEYQEHRWDARAWASYSFEHAEVRERCLAVVREVAERYDIDGFDLDFSRQPPFFDRGRGLECRHHMTDLIREARAILDEAGRRRGKRIKLSAPCRPTIAKSENVGLDPAAWVAEGLVDILMPCQDGGGGTDLSLEQFIELARGTDVEICPNVDNVARPGVTANIYATSAVLRAAAMTCHASGAHGMQLFNYFAINEPGHFETQLYREGVFSEIGDADALRRKDKYCIFRQGLPLALTGGRVATLPDTGLSGNYWINLPLDTRVPPPAPGREKSGRAELQFRFHVADDVEEARAAGVLAELRLAFSIVHVGPDDDIRFAVNGEPVPASAITTLYRRQDPLPGYCFLPPYAQYAIDLAAIKGVRNGWNSLEIKAVALTDNPGPDGEFGGLDAVFHDAELCLRYIGS